MPEEIYKLDPYADNMVAIVSKLNELIDAWNEANKPKSYAPVDNLWTGGSEMVSDVLAGVRLLSAVLDQWNVNFYDDVPPAFESPVYCRACQYRSQSLLDRMMLNPRALCEGCAYKSAHG